MSINISDLTNALTKVEHVHKVQLENVHQFFFKKNEALSIETFSQIIACDSIDERFKNDRQSVFAPR